MMILYGDRVRTHQEVTDLFNTVYPGRQTLAPLSSRIFSEFTQFVRDIKPSGRPSVPGETKVNICYFQPMKLTRNFVLSTVSSIPGYHSYQVRLLQRHLEQDYDWTIELYENKCQNYPNFSKNGRTNVLPQWPYTSSKCSLLLRPNVLGWTIFFQLKFVRTFIFGFP